MINVSNPELLRYLRSELRPARVAIIMGGTLVGALLMALFISAQTQQENVYTRSYSENVYGAIFVASSIILVLWSLLNASQAVVSERTHRTFDFWRTTRLSPMTLAVGKLFGAPIGAWLQFAAAFPVAMVLGMLGGFRITTIAGSFLLVGLCNVALSALALCLSMRAQDQRRATMLMLVLVLILLPSLNGGSMFVVGHRTGLGAWSALNPIQGIVAWHQGYAAKVSLFGHSAPSIPITIGLCLVIIAWCLAALARSIKLEPDQSSLFSPLQVIGISACLLLFNYAAFVPWGNYVAAGSSSVSEQYVAHTNLEGLILTGVMTTFLCLYFTVNSTLFKRDVLRHELRAEPTQKVAFKLITPWLATGLTAMLAAVLALLGYRALYTGEPIPWVTLISVYVLIAVYAVRDGMFLQWMITQRVKAPVLKGMALLFCYYVGSAVLSAAVVGPRHAPQMMRWLAPISGDPAEGPGGPAWLVVLLLVPPLATAALLASGVFRKMQRVSQPVSSPVQA
jgi:hypothetical protein